MLSTCVDRRMSLIRGVKWSWLGLGLQLGQLQLQFPHVKQQMETVNHWGARTHKHTHIHTRTDLPILRTRAGHKDQLQSCTPRREGGEGGREKERTSWERNSLAKLSCNACTADQSISRCRGPWVAGCQGSSNWPYQSEYSACPLRVSVE